ncbi:MAG: acetate--CoA ligase family protein [Thermoplasmata archaeon]
MEVIEFLKNLKRDNLEEYEAKEILKTYKIPVPAYKIIKGDYINPNLNYPLAIKVSDPEILHKTDVGGVILNIKDEAELINKFNILKTKFPRSNILIEEMQRPGVEIIIGIIKDPTFGLSIMFGMGGIYAELYKDVTFRLIPISRIDAEEMLEDIKAKQIFYGFRGMKVYRDGVIDLLLKISKIAEDLKQYINQMDLNPVFVRENDIVVVDAKMIINSKK